MPSEVLGGLEMRPGTTHVRDEGMTQRVKIRVAARPGPFRSLVQRSPVACVRTGYFSIFRRQNRSLGKSASNSTDDVGYDRVVNSRLRKDQN